MIQQDFVDINNARPGSQYENVIKKIKDDGVCPFCPEQLAKYHTNPILKETKYWKATDNMYPYKSIKHHMLFIHKEHITHLNELSLEAWEELQTIFKEYCKERNITGGSIVCRFGETRYTGASVTHLHAHLVQSDPDSPDYNDKREMIGVAMRIG